MAEVFWLCLAGVATFIGIAWFALSLDVHWRQVVAADTKAAAPAASLRLAGALSLAASFVFCLNADHASMAVLVWIMSLAANAVLVAMILAWQPQRLRVLTLPWASNRLAQQGR